MIRLTIEAENMGDFDRLIARVAGVASSEPVALPVHVVGTSPATPDADTDGGEDNGKTSGSTATPATGGTPPPTPAIKAELETLNIPESVWPTIPGTGKGGRLTKADVHAYARANPARLTQEADPLAGTGADTSTDTDETDPLAGLMGDDTASPPKEATIADCKAAMSKLAEKLGIGTVREAIQKFGAKDLGGLKMSDYAPFVAHCEAMLTKVPASA